MGNMNSQVVVLVVIIAAGAAVLIGYATTRYFVGRVPDGDTEGPGSDFNQANYMREVRLRNSEQLAGINGYKPHRLVRISFLLLSYSS